MNELMDEARVAWSEFIHKQSRLVNSLGTIFRWLLLTVVPVILGAYLTIILEDHIRGEFQLSRENISSTEGLRRLGPLVLLTTFSVSGQLWRTENAKRYLRGRLLDTAIRWLYLDLGFEDQRAADVRCTLWTPLNSKVVPEKIRLLQIVDYIPTLGRSSPVTDALTLRRNKKSGRIRSVARIEKGDVKPIGIVGKCVVESMRDHTAYIMFEKLKEGMDFTQRMVNFWNFTKADAKRLTRDRKSYMSITLMNSGRTDILGIIFMDSRLRGTFTQTIANKSQQYLPRIAEILTD